MSVSYCWVTPRLTLAETILTLGCFGAVAGL
jgi:hypothetical protein